MIKFAITGNIASGKSHVEKILKENGFKVFDADLIAHEILIQNKTVIEVFSDYDILENGELSRIKLGKLIFADKALREKLEDIIHPLVKKKILDLFEEYKKDKYIFISVPLLFETDMNTLFDKIILVSIEKGLQLKRLVKRNKLLNEDALLRINAQLSEDLKRDKSDYILENNSTIDAFTNKIKSFIETLD